VIDFIFIKYNTAEFHGKMSSRFSFGSKSENMTNIQHAYFHTEFSEILIKLKCFLWFRSLYQLSIIILMHAEYAMFDDKKTVLKIILWQ